MALSKKIYTERMAIKPFDRYEDEDSYESDSVTTGNMLKMVFLMLILFMAGFYAWYSYAYGDEINKRRASAGVRPTSAVSPTSAFKASAKMDDEAEDILSDIKNESAGLLDSSMKQASVIGGNVMGEATKQVQNTASSSAAAVTDTVTNSLYENTIGKVILQLINSLPEEVQKTLVEDICVETKECNPK